MNIECILKREGGSKIDLDGTTYHFAPNSAGAHVAAVEDKAHRNRFLSIAEGYQIYDGAPAKKTAVANSTVATVLSSSDNFPASFEIGDKTYSLGDIVAKAHVTSGLTPEVWNELPVDERDALIDAELDGIAAAGPSDDSDSALATAKAAYKEKFGRAAHYTWSVDTINVKLAE